LYLYPSEDITSGAALGFFWPPLPHARPATGHAQFVATLERNPGREDLAPRSTTTTKKSWSTLMNVTPPPAPSAWQSNVLASWHYTVDRPLWFDKSVDVDLFAAPIPGEKETFVPVGRSVDISMSRVMRKANAIAEDNHTAVGIMQAHDGNVYLTGLADSNGVPINPATNEFGRLNISYPQAQGSHPRLWMVADGTRTWPMIFKSR
jgi:hypothetical protein